MRYTYKDWLTGKLKANDLTALYAEKLISQEDYNKIRKAQVEAFDASFTMAFEIFKRIFLAKIANLSMDKSIAYLEGMQDYYKRYIDRKSIHNPTMFDGVRLGVKCLDGITGLQYREIKALWKGFKNNKIKHVTNYPTKYLELFTNYGIHEWLEKQPVWNKPKGETESRKIFPEYLVHEKNKQLAEKIKQRFTTEKGKSIKLLLLALEEKGMVAFSNRQFKALYESIRVYFSRNIGSYQSVNDYQYNKWIDKTDSKPILQKLDLILNELKDNK